MAASPIRPLTPLWVRLLVLTAFGLALASPVAYVAWYERHHDLRDATDAADKFLAALANNDSATLNTVVPMSAVQRADAFSNGLVRAGLLRGETGAARQGKPLVQVEFVLRRNQDALVKGPLAALAGNSRAAMEDMLAKLEAGRGLMFLRKGGQAWRVARIVFPADAAGDGPTFDFEAAIGTLAKMIPSTGGAGPPPPFAWLRPAAGKDVDRAWQATVTAKDKAAGGVADRLAKEMGITLSSDGWAEWRKSPVTVSLQKRSRLEALEEVARQVGGRLAYASGLSARLVPAGRPAAVAFAGPFRVGVTQVSEQPTSATGVVHLELTATNLPAAVAPLLWRAGPVWAVTEVRDAKGRDLYYARRASEPGSGFDGPTPPTGPTWGGFRQIPVRNLTADLRAIASIKGEVGVPVAEKVEDADLSLAEETPTAKVGDVELTCVKAFLREPTEKDQAPPILRRLTVKGPPRRLVLWRVLDAAGVELQSGATRSGRTSDLIGLMEGATQVTCKVVTLATVVYPFELKDVPLTDRPPDQLDPPVFSGKPAPVSVGMYDPKASTPFVTVTNHSQKVVEEVTVLVKYLDDKGQPLKEDRVTLTDRPPAGVPMLTTFVGAHASRGAQFPAAPPKAAARADFELVEVLFADGTTWTPGKR